MASDLVSASTPTPEAGQGERCGAACDEGSRPSWWAPCDRENGHKGPHTWPLDPPCPSVFRDEIPCERPAGHLIGDLPHYATCRLHGGTHWVEWDQQQRRVGSGYITAAAS